MSVFQKREKKESPEEHPWNENQQKTQQQTQPNNNRLGQVNQQKMAIPNKLFQLSSSVNYQRQQLKKTATRRLAMNDND